MRTIAIQGIKGCFHEMAARKHFREELNLVECDSFRKVGIALKEGKCDYGIVAIENTLAGSLLPNYSLIQKHKFHVVGEVYLHIEMSLLAYPGVKLNEIKEVWSHPVALAQCDAYLEDLEGIELVEYHDTAAAAKWVGSTKSETVAAISNELSAELYGLEVLARSIETHKKNYTRFLVLAREKILISGADKASISLEVSHQPGALADVLTIFKNYSVNLTKIQSVPIIGKPYQYAFKIDLTWDDYSNYSASLEKIRTMGCNVLVLGEYISQDFST